jgi:hypothetical protein
LRGFGAILLILDEINVGHKETHNRCLPLDSHDEDQLGLLIDKEAALLSAHASQPDLLALGIAILFDVGLGTLEDDTTLFLVGLKSMLAAVSRHWHAHFGIRNIFSPERWYNKATTWTRRSGQRSGIYHHQKRYHGCSGVYQPSFACLAQQIAVL